MKDKLKILAQRSLIKFVIELTVVLFAMGNTMLAAKLFGDSIAVILFVVIINITAAWIINYYGAKLADNWFEDYF